MAVTGRKRRFKLHELSGGRVTYLSLVDRGANRAPWKILKREAEDMRGIQFDKVFEGARKRAMANFEPAIVAFAVAPGADVEAIKRVLEANGYSTENQEAVKGEDGQEQATVFLQEAPEGADLGQDLAVALPGAPEGLVACAKVSKEFVPWPEGGSFIANMKQAGVFPTLDMSTRVLMSTLENILRDSEGPEAAATAAKEALDEFSTFSVEAIRSIPEAAFKFDGTKGAAADEGDGDAAKGEGEAPAEADGEGAGDGEGQGDGEEAGDEAIKAVQGSIDALGEKLLGKIAEQGEALGKRIDQVAEQAGNARELAESAQKAVDRARGEVVTDAEEDEDEPAPRRQRKSAAPPLLDSAHGRVNLGQRFGSRRKESRAS